MSKKIRRRPGCGIGGAPDRKVTWNNLLYAVDGETIGRARSPDRAGAVRKQKLGLWRRGTHQKGRQYVVETIHKYF